MALRSPATDTSPGIRLGIIPRLRSYASSFPRAVWLLTAATMVESTGRFMVVPYLSLYMHGAGVSLGALGLVLAASPVASVVFGAWGGHLSDKWGRKPVQVVGVATSGLAMFGFAFAGGAVWLLALLNFMNGMTRTFYRPATNAAISDHCPADRRSEAFALNRIALNAAFGWGPLIGVALFAAAPKAGFIAAGTLNLAVGLFLALAVPESAPLVLKRRAARAPLPVEAALARGQSSSRAAVMEILRDGVFWLWMAGMSLTWGAYGLIQDWLGIFLKEGGLAPWVYAGILFVNSLVCVFGQLPMSRLLRVARIGPSAGLSKLAFVAGFLGFAFLGSPVPLLLSMFTLSVGEIWGSAVQSRFVPEHARPELLGRYMGLTTVSELGRAVVSAAAGFLMQAAGGESVFVMAAGVSVAGGALMWLAGKAHDIRR